MGSKVGVDKIAAGRLRMSYEDYLAKLSSGVKWCYRCRAWKQLHRFGNDSHRGDGLDATCFQCRRVAERKTRQVRAPSLKVQNDAGNAIKKAVLKGKLAAPTLLPCSRCTKPAEIYHHHLGYAQYHWLDVHALCRSCHSYIHWNGEVK